MSQRKLQYKRKEEKGEGEKGGLYLTIVPIKEINYLYIGNNSKKNIIRQKLCAPGAETVMLSYTPGFTEIIDTRCTGSRSKETEPCVLLKTDCKEKIKDVEFQRIRNYKIFQVI